MPKVEKVRPRHRFFHKLLFDETPETLPYILKITLSPNLKRPRGQSPNEEEVGRAAPDIPAVMGAPDIPEVTKAPADIPAQAPAQQEVEVEQTPAKRQTASDGRKYNEAPFGNFKDRRLYGKNSFYYHLFVHDEDISQPPDHPPGMTFQPGTLFIHRNPTTSKVQSWIWENDPARVGEGLWAALQNLEERQIHSRAYVYTVSARGYPSWVLRDTHRKKQNQPPAEK